MINGIIYRLMRNYYRQNTNKSDYYNIAVKLFEHHVARGWDIATIKSLILAADTRIKSTPPTPTPPSTPTHTTVHPRQTKSAPGTIDLHWQYHPNDIPRNKICSIYNSTLQEIVSDVLEINKLVAAYSKPPNLKGTRSLICQEKYFH
ncbi:hypothetical protein ACHAXR_000239 [Thalassiosira sp. AJA248-18]